MNAFEFAENVIANHEELDSRTADIGLEIATKQLNEARTAVCKYVWDIIGKEINEEIVTDLDTLVQAYWNSQCFYLGAILMKYEHVDDEVLRTLKQNESERYLTQFLSMGS